MSRRETPRALDQVQEPLVAPRQRVAPREPHLARDHHGSLKLEVGLAPR